MTDKLEVVDLANLEIPTKEVQVTDTQAVSVTGVPYNELMRLFKDNIDLLDKALKGDGSAVTDLLENQPKRVGHLIAFACAGGVEPSEQAVANACKLPAFRQAQIVHAMFELTFPDAEALGKFMAEVETLLKHILVANLQQKVVLASGTVQQKP